MDFLFRISAYSFPFFWFCFNSSICFIPSFSIEVTCSELTDDVIDSTKEEAKLNTDLTFLNNLSEQV